MPPTAFAPSHSTGFKSTLSSSRQPSDRHSKVSATAELTAQDIVPSQWAYHCEGGKNILLSLTRAHDLLSSRFVVDGRPLALRIAKSEQNGRCESDSDRFTEEIIAPLLGDTSLLPRTVKIRLQDDRDRHIIESLASSIEIHRPSSRRQSLARINVGVLDHVYAIENVTAPDVHVQSSDTLCVEVKPKWGFLPCLGKSSSESPFGSVKSRYSRYKMHRVAKMHGLISVEQFDNLYDPLDLYSTDEGRMAKAIAALFRDWLESEGKTNNLRLFWNGNIVATNDHTTLRAISVFLAGSSNVAGSSDGLLEGLTTTLISELSKRQVPSLDQMKGPCTVLERLAYLQAQLDPLDVEGLARSWLELTRCENLGQFGPDQQIRDPTMVTLLTVRPTVDKLKDALNDVFATKDFDALPQDPVHELAQHIYRFLLSSTFKDCSLLVRCTRSDSEAPLQTLTKVIDLDLKPMSKLAKFQQTDRDVCGQFSDWLAKQTMEPKRSHV